MTEGHIGVSHVACVIAFIGRSRPRRLDSCHRNDICEESHFIPVYVETL